MKEKVFERFYRKDAGSGSGLAHTIIRNHQSHRES
jgi:signal transduction histidine kinase